MFANAASGARVVRGRAVNLLEGEVVVEIVHGTGKVEERVAFDVLVVATGSGYGAPIRETATATRAERLAEVEAWSAALDRAGSVLVVGGGAVGVELAAEVAYKKKTKNNKKGGRVVLATAAPELVTDLPPSVRLRALKALTALGVDVALETRAHLVAAAADDDEKNNKTLFFGAGVYELTQDGGAKKTEERFDAAVFCFAGRPKMAWCAGKLACDARGFVLRDPVSLAAAASPMATDATNSAPWTTTKCAYYVVGDCAAKPDAQRLASFAHFEGEFAAHVIRTRQAGLADPQPYLPPARMVALSLGPYDGAFVFDSTPIPMPGFLVPVMKRAIEAWFVRLLPLPYAIAKLLPGDVNARSWTKQPRQPQPAAAASGTNLTPATL